MVKTANEKLFEILQESLDVIKNGKYEEMTPHGKALEYSPYFCSLSVKSQQKGGVIARNGGIFGMYKLSDPEPEGRLEIRMGDPSKGGGAAYGGFDLPWGFNKRTSVEHLKSLAEFTFWGAVDNYVERLNNAMGMADKRGSFMFYSEEEPVVYSAEELDAIIDMECVAEVIRKVSEGLEKDPNILISQVQFSLNKEDRHLVNTEGTKIYSNYIRYAISVNLQMIDSHNFLVPHTVTLSGRDLDDIPSYETLMAAGEKAAKELYEIVNAPFEGPGAMPAILCPANHGVLWHEVVGHALEAQNSIPNYYGDVESPFAGMIGELIAPDFLSVYDDPTIEQMEGHYLYDEEGVPAQRVELIKDGVLRNLLHSRDTAGYFGHRSNGHARAQGDSIQAPRMSNLIVESDSEVSLDGLKAAMIQVCEQLNKDYGLILEGTGGGLTIPEDSFYNVYPVHVHRLYRDGDMERVRGIYVVGTPHHTLKNILLTGDEYEYNSGVCGAGSGWVPSTQTAPHALVSLLEVNRIPRQNYTKLRERIYIDR